MTTDNATATVRPFISTRDYATIARAIDLIEGAREPYKPLDYFDVVRSIRHDLYSEDLDTHFENLMVAGQGPEEALTSLADLAHRQGICPVNRKRLVPPITPHDARAILRTHALFIATDGERMILDTLDIFERLRDEIACPALEAWIDDSYELDDGEPVALVSELVGAMVAGILPIALDALEASQG